MQDRPDKVVLLAAIAQFLATEVRPVIDDKGLGFRVLIAAHLLGGIAREVATEDDLDSAQLADLHALLDLDAEMPGRSDQRRAAIAEANRRLAEQIRAGEMDLDAAARHLKRVLQGKLQVSNPQFDLSQNIE